MRIGTPDLLRNTREHEKGLAHGDQGSAFPLRRRVLGEVEHDYSSGFLKLFNDSANAVCGKRYKHASARVVFRITFASRLAPSRSSLGYGIEETGFMPKICQVLQAAIAVS
ncbi:MAG: hypothetical protein WKF37_22180 [Bryobacteraceae bacterium]